ncbi:hypothetical protein LTR27_011932 [Elasticomyces elasticus]|nr:hypothetical protein LTR27_011932 [Elasticomyces elasticus]
MFASTSDEQLLNMTKSRSGTPSNMRARYCEVGFRQYGGYTGVQLYGPADDRQWLVTLKSARYAKRAAGGARIKKQVGKIVLYEAENGYS